MVERMWSENIEPAEEAAAAMAEFGDEEFRRHCRVRRWQGGVLVLEVDDRAMVPMMRLKWSAKLRREWPSLGLNRALRRVTFEHGRSGAPLSR